MTDNVHKLELVDIGQDVRLDCDAMLEAAKGKGFSRLLIIADYAEEAGIWVSGSANAGESLVLIELAKPYIVGGGE